MRRTGVAAIVVLVVFAAGARAGEVKVKGRVVDEEGKAVAGAEVATFWGADDKRPMFAYRGSKPTPTVGSRWTSSSTAATGS
jgi:protocatechuate 3,4-dioxygenase beta subunit